MSVNMALVWRSALVLVLAHFVVCQTRKQCPEPPKYIYRVLDSRHLNKSVFNEQEVVWYKCSLGYEHLSGSRQSTCRNGKWTTLSLTCQKKKCNGLADIENGRYNRHGRLFGAKAVAKCNTGYVLRGEKVRVCLADGWNGTNPTCEKGTFCSAPVVANQWITAGERVQYTSGESVNITCREGFDLVGSPEVTCGADGKWRDLPRCNRKDKCGPAPLHPNAFLRDGSSTLEEYSSGDRIRYKCDVGFHRVAGSDAIQCEEGQWTALQLQCERKSCGSAGDISFGRFHYTGVLFGDSATAVCQEGYELSGPGTRVCRDGGWDGRIPMCEPVYCPPPPEVRDADISDFRHEHVPFGHMVSYRCLTGTLIGARDMYCTKQGTWSHPPPECKDIACPHPHVPYGSRMRGFRALYKFGHTVSIACNPGLRLVGQGLLTCGADGKWKPALPTCQRFAFKMQHK